MNAQRKRYLFDRIDSEKYKKREAIEKKYPLIPTDTDKQKALIVKHHPPFLPWEEICERLSDRWMVYATELFDLSVLFPDLEETKQKRSEALAALEARAQTIKDKAILGDAQDALDLLNAFIKEEF